MSSQLIAIHPSLYRNLWDQQNARKCGFRKCGDIENVGCQSRNAELMDDTPQIHHPFNRQPTKMSAISRGMERIRRSLRESFRIRVRRRQGGGVQSPNCPLNGSKSELWQPDEAAVRNGTCSFNVKYLGGIEVFESRGMQICEGALKLLRGQKRRPVKAVLYVSGDGLRVVDQESSRGLIVDQTIEKVSFCAPDRNHDKGFAYICRDGTSRRWMCHGFLATKETGERLSHAVGCAFAICLERKKKRDAEVVAAVQVAAGFPTSSNCKGHTPGFTLNGSMTHGSSFQSNNMERNSTHGPFRRLSITERVQDPQTAIVRESPPSFSNNSGLNITAKPRPLANPQLFDRQGSLRAPSSNACAFRRHLSLRSYSDSPSKKCQSAESTSGPIIEDDEERNWPSSSSNKQMNVYESAPNYVTNGANGIRQSISFSGPSPSDVDNCDTTLSPLRRTINSSSYMNDISLRGLKGPKSRADVWLEQTLRSSLCLKSPARSADESLDLDNGIGPPPAHPPPPLPSTSSANTVSSSPSINHRRSQATMSRFSGDFSHSELPPINENFVFADGLNSSLQHEFKSEAIDVFGQPVFNPMPSTAVASVPRDRTLSADCFNGSINNATSKPQFNNTTIDIERENDPFDVRWSELAVSLASKYHHRHQSNTGTQSTNPFHSASSALNLVR